MLENNNNTNGRKKLNFYLLQLIGAYFFKRKKPKNYLFNFLY